MRRGAISGLDAIPLAASAAPPVHNEERTTSTSSPQSGGCKTYEKVSANLVGSARTRIAGEREHRHTEVGSIGWVKLDVERRERSTSRPEIDVEWGRAAEVRMDGRQDALLGMCSGHTQHSCRRLFALSPQNPSTSPVRPHNRLFASYSPHTQTHILRLARSQPRCPRKSTRPRPP